MKDDVKHRWQHVNAQLGYHAHLQNETTENAAFASTPMDVTGEDSSTLPTVAPGSEDFAKKRMKHYNEFKVSQALRMKQNLEDEDDDEDE